MTRRPTTAAKAKKRVPKTIKPAKRSHEPIRTLTLQVPAVAHEQLREIASRSRRSQLSLAVEGLNLLFERQGKPPIGPLHTCGVKMKGDWRLSNRFAKRVVSRMRDVCLGGVTLRSDRQPDGLFVDNRPSGTYPAIWLHTTPARTAWVLTCVGERDWCRLAYQFGHELGHVLTNSWQRDAVPQPPCQWLEEALVETFSLRGLQLLADSWAKSPPFGGDTGFSNWIRVYRNDILARYHGYATKWGGYDLKKWYRAHKAKVSKINGCIELVQSVVPALLARIEADPALTEDYGAMNRWSGRSGVPPKTYFRLWRESCAEIGSSGRLPIWLAEVFGYNDRRKTARAKKRRPLRQRRPRGRK